MVSALERDLPVLSHTPHGNVDRQEIGVDQTQGGTPRSVQDDSEESSECHQGTCLVWGCQSRPSHECNVAGSQCWWKDDTVIGEAQTISQEERPARRLVLVGGRSGREGVESRQPDRSGHVDADGDSAVSGGGPDSVGVSNASEAEEIEVPVVVGVPPVPISRRRRSTCRFWST